MRPKLALGAVTSSADIASSAAVGMVGADEAETDKAARGVGRPDQRRSGPESAFSKSMVVSGIRCTLAYVLIPYVFPLVGFGAGAGPWIGLPIGLAAIVANVVSIVRFGRSDHRWKRPVIAINSAVIVLLAILVVIDAADLAG